jgi:hypothetical protein
MEGPPEGIQIPILVVKIYMTQNRNYIKKTRNIGYQKMHIYIFELSRYKLIDTICIKRIIL